MTDAVSLFLGLIWKDLLSGPSSFWVVLIALGVLCWRYKELPSRYALLPVGLFLVLFCFNQAWNLVEIPPKVGFEAPSGKFTAFDENKDLALKSALKVTQDLILPAAARQGVENAERLRVAVIYPENIEALRKAHTAYQFGIFATAVSYITVAAILVVVALRMFGIIAAMMFVTLAGAEIYTFLVHWVGCNLLLEDTSAVVLNRTWGQTVATAVCDREIGPWFETIGMLVFVGIMFWLLKRYSHAVQTHG